MPTVDESIRRAEERIDRVLEEGVTWEGKVEARGHAKSMQQGMQQLVLRLLGQRFGPLSPAVRQRVEAIASGTELTRLAERLVTAGSPSWSSTRIPDAAVPVSGSGSRR